MNFDENHKVWKSLVQKASEELPSLVFEKKHCRHTPNGFLLEVIFDYYHPYLRQTIIEKLSILLTETLGYPVSYWGEIVKHGKWFRKQRIMKFTVEITKTP